MPQRKSSSPGPASPTANGSCDCGPFLLDALGPFGRRNVTLTWTDRERRSTAEIDRLIDRAWDQAMDLARRTGRKLYDGQLCRLIDYAVKGRTLHLVAGPTTFREFLGTNYANPHLVHTAGPEVLASPLGVSAAVIASDGFIVLGRRSDQVAWHGGMVHPIGGIVELDDASRPQHPFDAMRKELREETGTVPRRGGPAVCLGLVRDKALPQPELIFRIDVAADVRTLRASAKGAVEGNEHSELVAVRDRPTSVVSFIEKHGQETTPVALATLLLYGLDRWGSDWFATARGYLRKLL
ncbi:MAG: NUDIX hydrolase [Phycisphaerae bacterium]|nr:NUDIX hydrolase [Phycisphaerae bacterium]